MERARLVRTAMKKNAQPGQSGQNGQSVQRKDISLNSN